MNRQYSENKYATILNNFRYLYRFGLQLQIFLMNASDKLRVAVGGMWWFSLEWLHSGARCWDAVTLQSFIRRIKSIPTLQHRRPTQSVCVLKTVCNFTVNVWDLP